MSCRYRKQNLFPWRTFKIYHIEVDFMEWSRSQLLRSRTGLVKFYNLNHRVNILCRRKSEDPEKNDEQLIYLLLRVVFKEA